MLAPALIWPDLHAEPAWASRRLRSRWKKAAKRELSTRDLPALAAQALGVAPLPAGAVARLADGLEVRGRDWFRAEPVMWLPSRDGLRLLALDEAPLSAAEGDALMESARAHFGDRLVAERGGSGRWYVALAGVHEVRSQPLEDVVGATVQPQDLAQGPDGARLRRFVNELQMLWFEHPVNVTRHRDGLPVANALWLWGCGRLARRPNLAETPQVHAEESQVRALLEWLGVGCRSVSDDVTKRSAVRSLVVIGAGDGGCGRDWLEAFGSIRGAWRLFAADGEWRFPARRIPLFWRG